MGSITIDIMQTIFEIGNMHWGDLCTIIWSGLLLLLRWNGVYFYLLKNMMNKWIKCPDIVQRIIGFPPIEIPWIVQMPWMFIWLVGTCSSGFKTVKFLIHLEHIWASIPFASSMVWKQSSLSHSQLWRSIEHNDYMYMLQFVTDSA